MSNSHGIKARIKGRFDRLAVEHRLHRSARMRWVLRRLRQRLLEVLREEPQHFTN